MHALLYLLKEYKFLWWNFMSFLPHSLPRVLPWKSSYRFSDYYNKKLAMKIGE